MYQKSQLMPKILLQSGLTTIWCPSVTKTCFWLMVPSHFSK